MMKDKSGIAIDWTPQEISILNDALIKYPTEQNAAIRYAKIASELENKTVRDIAMRCNLKHKKVTNPRRRRLGVDNNKVLNLTNIYTNELIEENNQLFNQITENLTSLKLRENITLFSKIADNIRKLHKDMNENAPESMQNMPPLLEVLNDELLVEAIFLSSNLP